MINIIAHRGHWIGITKMQNTLESIIWAKKAGFKVEVDLRYDVKTKEIYLSHDDKKVCSNVRLKTVIDHFNGNLPTMFFHIKDNASRMIKRLIDLTDKIKTEYFFFGLNKEEKEEYYEIFGWEKIMYELEVGIRGSVKEALNSESKIIWFGLNKDGLLISKVQINELEKLLKSNKDIYFCSPELFRKHFAPSFFMGVEKYKGVCTDLPLYYKYKYDIT